MLGDFNGDGKTDILKWSDTYTGNALFLSNGDGSFTQAPNFNITNTNLSHSDGTIGSLLGDFNGDGKTDILVWANLTLLNALFLSNGDGSFTRVTNFAVTSGVKFTFIALRSSSGSVDSLLGDFNGDGKTDILRTTDAYTNNALFLSNGDGTFTSSSGFNIKTTNLTHSNKTVGSLLGDFNGDGKTDVLRYMDTYTNNVLYLSNGGGGFTQATSFNLTGASLNLSNGTVGSLLGDFAGDGRTGILRWSNTPTNNTIFTIGSADVPDKLSSIQNGIGAKTGFSQVPISDSSVYTKDVASACTSPNTCVDVQDATYVVGGTTQSDGINGWTFTRYQYGGLKRHSGANASLGFRWIKVTDPAGLATTTYFNQSTSSGATLDGTEGTVSSSETWANGVRIKYTSTVWTPIALGGGRTLASLTSNLVMSYELTNGVIGAAASTTYSNYDSYGNPGTIVAAFSNDTSTKTTTNTYVNDTTNWLLGKLTYIKASIAAAGQTPQYRESSFEYDATYPWRLSREIIEPARASLALTAVYGYDGFGNRTTKTLSGPDITTRTAETLTYDTRGQFVTSRKNALNHTESFTYDARTGAVATATDVNGIVTTNSYDGLGRKTQVSRPGSPVTTISYLCWDGSVQASGVACPATTGMAITAVRTVTTGAGEKYVYSDKLGRAVQTNSQGFGGNWVYQQTNYDKLGRVASVSHPYVSVGTQRYTYYSYYPDALGRLWKVTEAGTGNRVTTMSYSANATTGFTTTTTNPLKPRPWS
jgi:YD repeat-containing protein